MADRRACDPKHLSQPGVGTRTGYSQHRSLADRIRPVVPASTHCISGLGLSSRPSIRRTLQFPLWDRTHSRVSPLRGRHRRFLVSVSPGEAVTGVAESVIALLTMMLAR